MQDKQDKQAPMKGYQENHSLINEFPIDYKKFPMAVEYKYTEVILYPNDYVVIPKYWSHWVFSDPCTVAISYNINNKNLSMNKNNEIEKHNKCKVKNNDNIIFSNLEKGLAHTGTYNCNYSFNYKDFINSSNNLNFFFICSENIDVCPIIKPNTNYNKFAFNTDLDDVLSDSFFLDKYLYVGQHPTTNFASCQPNLITNLLTIPNFDNIVNDTTFSYTSKLWFNFDKPVDSGLHADNTDNILYVLTGRKRVLLAHPMYNKYIYLSKLPTIPVIDIDEF
jgi:hypothetical protein